MALDLSSLRKSVHSLEKALTVASAENLKNRSESEVDVIKTGIIQNFEFTYELCWKFIKRWLDQHVGSVYVDGVSRRQLFRLGTENKLIKSVDGWMKYHHARNETSHTYNQDSANEIFQVTQLFFPDAKNLLTTLEQKND